MSAEIDIAGCWEAVARIRKANGDKEGAARAKVNKTARASATKYRAKFASCGSYHANGGHPFAVRESERVAA